MQYENENQQQRRFRLNLAGLYTPPDSLPQYLGVPFSGNNPYEESYKSLEQNESQQGDQSMLSQYNYYKIDWDDESRSIHNSELPEKEIKEISYEEYDDVNNNRVQSRNPYALNNIKVNQINQPKQIASGNIMQEDDTDSEFDDINLVTARRIEPFQDKQLSGREIPYMNQDLLTEIEENSSPYKGNNQDESDIEFALSNSQRFSPKTSPKNFQIEDIEKKKVNNKNVKSKTGREEIRDKFRVLKDEGKKALLEPVLKNKKIEKSRVGGSLEVKPRTGSPPGNKRAISPLGFLSSPKGVEKAKDLRAKSPVLNREAIKRPEARSASKKVEKQLLSSARSISRENESVKKVKPIPKSPLRQQKKPTPSAKPKETTKVEIVPQQQTPNKEPEKEKMIVTPPSMKTPARSPSSSGAKKLENEISDNESAVSSKSTPQQLKFKAVNVKKLDEEKVKYDKFLLAPKTLKIIKSLVKPQKPLQYCCYSLICLLSGYNSNIPKNFLKLKEEDISWADIRKFLNETCEILTNERNFRSFVSHLKLTKRHINRSSHYLVLCRKSLEEKTPFSSYCTDIVNFVDSILELFRQEYSLTKERSSVFDESSLVLSYQPIPERQATSEFEKTHSEIEKNISPLSKESSIQQNNVSKAEGNTINHILDELDEVNGVTKTDSDIHNNELNKSGDPTPILLEIQKENQNLQQSPEKLQEKLEKLQKIEGITSGNYLKKISLALTRPKLTMLININNPTSAIFSLGKCIILILSLYINEIPFSTPRLQSMASDWVGMRSLLKTAMNKLTSFDYTKAFSAYNYEGGGTEVGEPRMMTPELLKKITSSYYQFEREKLGSEPLFVFTLIEGVHAYLELYKCCTGMDISILHRSKEKSKQKITNSLSPGRSKQQSKTPVPPLSKKKSTSPPSIEAHLNKEPANLKPEEPLKSTKHSNNPSPNPLQFRKAFSPTQSVFLQQQHNNNFLSNKLKRDFSSKSRRYDSSDETRGSRLSGVRSTGSISPNDRPHMNRALRVGDQKQEKASGLGSSGKKNPKFFNNKDKRFEGGIPEEKQIKKTETKKKTPEIKNKKNMGLVKGLPEGNEGIGLLEKYFMEFINDKVIKEKEEIAKLDLQRFQDYVKLKIMKQNFDLCKAQWIEDFKKICKNEKWQHSISFLESLTENHTPEKSSPQPYLTQDQNIYNILQEKLNQTLLKHNLNHDDLLANYQSNIIEEDK